MSGADDRSRMPAEVRPALGPFVEAVPLLFRQETLEVAGILTMAPLALWTVHHEWAADPGPSVTLPGGFPLPLSALALSLAGAILKVAAIGVLLPVACGGRGLRPRVIFDQVGALGLAATVCFGVPTAQLVLLYLLVASGVDRIVVPILRCFPYWYPTMEFLLVAWSAWFLRNARRKHEGLPWARARLLAWPGIAVGVLPAGLVILLWSIGVMSWEWQTPFVQVRHLALYAFSTLLRTLLLLFAALWMIRVVENEADDCPAAGWTPRPEVGE